MPDLYPTFTAPAIVSSPAQALPAYPPSYLFDFDKADYVVDGAGRLVEIDGYSAWAQWCIAAVLTERFTALIFDNSMGVDYIGMKQQPNRAARQAWLEREITEALKVDPRTDTVTGFSFAWSGDAVQIGFTVTPMVGAPKTLEVVLGG